jgi:hypothetical protein
MHARQKSVNMPHSPKYSRRTLLAYHEAGHAVMASALADTPRVLTIRSAGRSAARTGFFSLFTNPVYLLQIALGGYASVHLYTRRIPFELAYYCAAPNATTTTLWDGDDLVAVTRMLRKLHRVRADGNLLEWFMKYYAMTRDCLRSVWPTVESIADALVAKTTLGRDELIVLFESNSGDIYTPIFAIQRAYGIVSPHPILHPVTSPSEPTRNLP